MDRVISCFISVSIHRNEYPSRVGEGQTNEVNAIRFDARCNSVSSSTWMTNYRLRLVLLYDTTGL